MTKPAISIAKQLVRFPIAALLASAAAGMTSGLTYAIAAAMAAVPTAPIYGLPDLFAGLVLTLGWLGMSILFGAFGGVYFGFLPALAAGSALAWLDHARLISRPLAWYLVGAATGVLTFLIMAPGPPMRDGLNLFANPDPILALICAAAGAAAGWVFRDLLRLFQELFPAES